MSWKDILKAKKPDFLDLDGDGNKKEPMSEAAKDVEKQTGKGLESIAHDEQDLKYLMSLNPQKLKQVLEARKRVSRNVPSDAGQRPRIPQFKPLGKQLQSNILKYIEYNPNTTVNKIIKGLNKNNLKKNRLKYFLDNHSNIAKEEKLSKYVNANALAVKETTYKVIK